MTLPDRLDDITRHFWRSTPAQQARVHRSHRIQRLALLRPHASLSSRSFFH